MDVGEALTGLVLCALKESGLSVRTCVRGASVGPPFLCADANAIVADHIQSAQAPTCVELQVHNTATRHLTYPPPIPYSANPPTGLFHIIPHPRQRPLSCYPLPHQSPTCQPRLLDPRLSRPKLSYPISRISPPSPSSRLSCPLNPTTNPPSTLPTVPLLRATRIQTAKCQPPLTPSKNQPTTPQQAPQEQRRIPKCAQIPRLNGCPRVTIQTSPARNDSKSANSGNLVERG